MLFFNTTLFEEKSCFRQVVLTMRLKTEVDKLVNYWIQYQDQCKVR